MPRARSPSGVHLIPRTMATQHPDNARVPEWAGGEVIAGEAEVEEAYLSYSMGIQEVMWDAEGKDVDTHVVRKLLTRYAWFFREHELGRDLLLTYRLPNPWLEGADRKVLSEVLESIPLSADVASAFYGRDSTPIFEVILPFTRSSRELMEIRLYYERAIAARGDLELLEGRRARDLVGDFRPRSIDLIPLLEDFESLVGAAGILEEYYSAVRPPHARVFLARSDPAMGHGMLAAVLAVKVALSRLYKLFDRHDLPVFPILGVGSLPFRGGLRPSSYARVLDEYRGVHTFTLQSAFRYDFPRWEVEGAISAINSSRPAPPELLEDWEEAALVSIAARCERAYLERVRPLARAVNRVADMLPKRRARKPHAGAFAYARSSGELELPRAIAFTGALYSMGIPPELLGISCLSSLREEDVDLLGGAYRRMREDLSWAAAHYDGEALGLAAETLGLDAELLRLVREDLEYLEGTLGIGAGPRDAESRRHSLLVRLFALSLGKERDEEARGYLLEAARERGSLG